MNDLKERHDLLIHSFLDIENIVNGSYEIQNRIVLTDREKTEMVLRSVVKTMVEYQKKWGL